MQVFQSFVTFLLLLLTITQYAEVQAQFRGKRQEQERQQIDLDDIDELAEELLEIEGLERTTQHNLLDEIEAAQQKRQQYEYDIQQQQEKLRKLQEQYEFELLEEQKKQQALLQQRQYATREQDKSRLRQYALRQRQKLEKLQQEERERERQKEQQQIDPNTEIDLVDNASESNFYEHHNDGTYAFGYALPNGVRRFERSYYADELQGMLVEGFYAEIRDRGTHKEYELHCYRSGPFGYRPMPVRALDHAPLVRRATTLDDDCFDK